MVYSSFQFIFAFLPLTVVGYLLLSRYWSVRVSENWLVITSLAFYGWWNIYDVPVILASILFNFYWAKGTSRVQNPFVRKLLFGTVVTLNVAALAFFKYPVLRMLGLGILGRESITIAQWAMPLGISYFTFQQIAFQVDAYRGLTQEFVLRKYSLFILFFPQLIMGPIAHHKEVIEQFTERPFRLNYENVVQGLLMFSIGLAKKTLLGDPLTRFAAQAFAATSGMTMLDAWLASIGHVMAFYFDLSGYADMAIGLGLVFNVELPINFNSPYKARNFVDYWQRWHISLSRFLGDYVFRSVYKRGSGSLNFYASVMLTFLVSGLWHGDGITFVIWGLVNGLFVCMGHYLIRADRSLPLPLAWALTFLGIIATRILFVSGSLTQAVQTLLRLFDFNSLTYAAVRSVSPSAVVLLLIGGILCFGFPNSNQIRERFRPALHYAILLAVLNSASLAAIYTQGSSKFLYFQF